MMKQVSLRISAFAVVLLLLLACMMPASAATGTLDDAGGVFTSPSQMAEAQRKLTEASEKTGWNIVFHSCNQGISGKELQNYGKTYLKEKGISDNALLFITDAQSGKSKILAEGEVNKYFYKSKRLDKMVDKLEPYTTAEPKDFYGAVMKFADEAVAVHDMGKVVVIKESLKRVGPFAGIAGVIIAVVFFFVTKSRYKNMGKSGTYDLAANSKVELNDVEDTYVTQHTTVRTIQKDNDGSSGSSSGSGSASRDF